MDATQVLTAEEQSLFDRLGPIFAQERLRMAKALAAKLDAELFGKHEFKNSFIQNPDVTGKRSRTNNARQALHLARPANL